MCAEVRQKNSAEDDELKEQENERGPDGLGRRGENMAGLIRLMKSMRAETKIHTHTNKQTEKSYETFKSSQTNTEGFTLQVCQTLIGQHSDVSEGEMRKRDCCFGFLTNYKCQLSELAGH